MTKEISGFILLFVGVGIILWSLYSSYNIFTVQTEVPEIFQLSQEGAAIRSGEGGELAQVEALIQQQLQAILPVDSISQLMNLMAWSIFAGILIFGGAQIAGLGVKLLK